MKTSKHALIALVAIALGVTGFYLLRDKKTATPTYINQEGSGAVSTGSMAVEENSATKTLAYVSKITGIATLTNISGKKIIETDTEIGLGDTIESDKNSQIEIVFADSSVVRLAELSTFSIVAQTEQSTEVSLLSGELWARILKPLGDSSFFTIKTSDLSAGVRGTAVVVKTDGKETASVHVIDSYGEETDKKAVDVTYRSGSEATSIWLDPEEGISLRERKIAKRNFKLTAMFAEDEFVRTNTKLDLLYLKDLQEKGKKMEDGKRDAFLKKVRGELLESMPKKDEIPLLFESRHISKKMESFDLPIASQSPISLDDVMIPANFLEALSAETDMGTRRLELGRMRETRRNFRDEASKTKFKQEVLQMETKISDFDVPWRDELAESGFTLESPAPELPPENTAPAPETLTPAAPPVAPPKVAAPAVPPKPVAAPVTPKPVITPPVIPTPAPITKPPATAIPAAPAPTPAIKPIPKVSGNAIIK